LSGCRGYPVWLRPEYSAGHVSFRLFVALGYSSTCPRSAALARQMLADAFLQENVEVPALSPQTVADWLRSNGSYATPH
ncbi:GTP cyclohydrolase I FolE2, partial [Xylella fastidiosa subsp. multiplex]|nr:GTP cyclohydrolase I FolE2 [Xylella fastidiosa subsp. multiplex]